MNKQIHVHSVNQWVACRLSSSRCRAHWSIGSVDAHTDAPRTRRTVRTRKQNRMAHTGPRACVRAWAKDFLPSRAPRRPVALLPELRRIVTRLDMPPRPRPAPRAHAHTIAFHFEHLIIMAHRSWNCCRSPAPAHSTTTSYINLISFYYRLRSSKNMEPDLYRVGLALEDAAGCRMRDIIRCKFFLNRSLRSERSPGRSFFEMIVY